MEISLISTSLTDIKTECLVIGVSEDDSVVGSSAELDTLISDLIDSGDFKAKAGSQITLRNPEGLGAKRLVLVGVGEADAFDALAQTLSLIHISEPTRPY